MKLFTVNGMIYASIFVASYYASKLVFGNKLEEIIMKKEDR